MERSCLTFARAGIFWARHTTEGETFLPIQPSFHSGIRVVPGNVVTVAIDMYGKNSFWEWIYRIT